MEMKRWPMTTDLFASAWNAQLDRATHSPILAHHGLLVQDPSGTNVDRIRLPNLAEPAMVPPPTRIDLRCATSPTTITESPPISSGTSTPSSSSQINLASRLEIIRDGYQRQGFSNEVVRLLLGGFRSSSQSAYQSSWVAWSNWCIRFNINPMSSSLINVLEFLAFLASNGKAYSTINVARSM
ncbi:Uncharacterized protein APZ42_010145, partial [Daphnia magna]